MLKKGVYISAIVIGIFVAIVAIKLFIISNYSKKNYHQTKQALLYNNKQKEGFSSREFVTKEFYTNQNSLLQKYVVSSLDSTLNFKQASNETATDFSEEMKDVVCHMQQELFYQDSQPMQRVMIIEFSKGNYDYLNKAFSSNEATIYSYEVLGHQLDINKSYVNDKLVMQGKTSNISMYIDNEAPKIICKESTELNFFKSLNDQSTIWCYDDLVFNFETNTLDCKSVQSEPLKQIHYKDSKHEVYCDTLIAYFSKSLDLETINLSGRIKLIQSSLDKAQNQPYSQYALADYLEYNPQKQKMILTALDGKHVLYLDEHNDYHLSAPKVILNELIMGQKPKVEGIGHVRLTFKEDEINLFEKSFLKKEKQ